MSDKRVDAITLEVIKNRLRSICDEMFIVVKKTAASPIYTESNDYSLAILDGEGNVLQISGTAAFHLISAKSVVSETMRLFGSDPGIDEGDIFMANDAYTAGGIHSMDIGIVSPVFYGGKLLAWAGSVAQQMDIGGMCPGGFNLEANECYQEGLRFTPMKLYEKGKLRKDLWNFYLANVRLADKQGIDMMGQVSANQIGVQRLKELCDEYGAETFKAACDALIKMAEDKLREKIRQLPDGVYEQHDYEEHDTKSHQFLKIKCTLTIKGDEMSFDFAGTAPQVQAPINSTIIGLNAGVFAALIPSLAWDTPWNEGLLRPISVSAPPGTIVNCQVPAPVSMCMVMFRAAEAAQACLSKAMSLSPYADRANAAWMGMWPIIIGLCMDQYGFPCLIPWMDGGPGGGGAWASMDGVDNACMIVALSANVCDVEWSETYYPLLFLERSVTPDSDGAGKFRGGMGIQVIATPYSTPGISLINAQTRKYFAGFTMSGGYPGGNHTQLVKRQTDLLGTMAAGNVPAWAELPGASETLDSKCRFMLFPGDVLRFTGGGGSGYGDPIDRDPDKVAVDVKWGYVTSEKAEAVYGVVVDRGTFQVDEAVTAQRRNAIREERLSSAVLPPSNGKGDGTEPAKVQRFGEYLEIVSASISQGSQGNEAEIVSANGDRRIRCAKCGQEISPLAENWKEHVIQRETSLAAAHANILEHEQVVFQQFVCPGCSTLLGTEINLRGEPYAWDYRPLS